MFNRIFDNIINGTGKIIELNGREYLQVDENSWSSNIGHVTCKFIVEMNNKEVSFNSFQLVDVKALISVKPNK